MRYPALDGIRGAALLSMVAYHAVWDLVYLFHLDWEWSPALGGYLWQQSICWTFILLSGFCWPLGKQQCKRGLVVFGAGMLVSAVTAVWMPGEHVLFGILTLLGSCILLLIPLNPLLLRIKPWIGCLGSLLLFAVLRDVNTGYLGFEGLRLLRLPAALYQNLLTAYLGFPPVGFYSVDYFPLLPWLFLFLAGYFLCRWVGQEGLARLPRRATPVLAGIGRHSLGIYLAHQPLICAVLTAVFWLNR